MFALLLVLAQEPTPRDTAVVDSIRSEAQFLRFEQARRIKWYHAAAAFGIVGATMALDEPLMRYAQSHQSTTADDISFVFRQAGEPLFYAAVSAGTLGIGFLMDDADVKRAGRRMVATSLLAGILMGGAKRVLGRSRPNEGTGAFVFHPFTSGRDSAGIQTRGSMPSGHTAAAFALATTVAADVDNPIVDGLVYTFAAGTAFSRVYDNRHWLSDITMGMVLGVTSAKFISGQWRFFNIKPPDFLLTPTGTPALGWTIPLRGGRP